MNYFVDSPVGAELRPASVVSGLGFVIGSWGETYHSRRSFKLTLGENCILLDITLSSSFLNKTFIQKINNNLDK